MRGAYYRFGKFELLPESEELRKSGMVLRMAHQPFRILLMLVSRAGEVVTREEIRDAIWPPGTYVDHGQGINTAIRQIRAALNDTAEAPRYVQTLPRLGYRFVAAVERVVPEELVTTLESLLTPHAPPAEEPRGTEDPRGTAEPRGTEEPSLRRRRSSLLTVLIVLALTLFAGRDEPVSANSGQLRIALEPFRVLGEAKVDAAALRAEVATRVGDLHPRLIQIADQDADVLLGGTIQPAPEGARVTLRAVDGRTRALLWSETYNRAADGELVMELGYRAMHAVAVRYMPPPRVEPLVRSRVSRRALELYRQARVERLRPRPQRNLDRALVLFGEAIQREPEFAEAWSGIGDIWVERASEWTGTRREVAAEQARIALRRAVQLDPRCAEAHNDLGVVQLMHERAYGAAEDSLRRAIAADPEYVDSYVNLALLLSAMGLHDAAVAEFRRLQQRFPQRYAPSTVLASIYFMARRDTDARAEHRAAELVHQRNVPAPWELDETDDYSVAARLAVSGEPDAAFAALDRAIDAHLLWALQLFVDPRFDRLRQDPRFAERLARMRFAS